MQMVGSNLSEMCLHTPFQWGVSKKWSPKMIKHSNSNQTCKPGLFFGGQNDLEQKIHSMKHGEIAMFHHQVGLFELRHKELVLLRRRPQRPRRATWMVGDFLGYFLGFRETQAVESISCYIP